MISEFKIGNFKAFGPAQTIPLRPITLVFGPNSAGKSSIIQSLLLARHIHDTGNADAYQTTLGGAAVDLGGFAKFVRNRDSSLRTTIQFSCNPSEYGRQFFYLNKFQTLRIKFTISVPNAEGANAKAVIESATILMDDLELLHLIRGEDGQLHFDEATFLDRSFLSRGRFWSSGSLERLGLFRAIFGEPGKLGPSEIGSVRQDSAKGAGQR